jgi:hypothetical protein
MPDNLADIEKKYLEKLNNLDVETLNVLEKYSEAHSKSLRAQTWVSTVIASIAGAAVTAAYIFPEIDKLSIIIGSAAFGVFLAYFALKERSKEHRIFINDLLDKEIHIIGNDEAIRIKKDKIEKIIKGGTL